MITAAKRPASRSQSPSPNPRPTSASSPKSTLAITGVATLLVLIDFTTVVPTIQDTATTFGASVVGRTWALSAMSLGLTAALLTAGALADQLGRRRTLRAGLVALAVSTAVAAAAPSIAIFVAARIGQGVAGAAVLTAALAMIGHAHPAGRARVRATGIWGATLGGGIAAGPLLSSVPPTRPPGGSPSAIPADRGPVLTTAQGRRRETTP